MSAASCVARGPAAAVRISITHTAFRTDGVGVCNDISACVMKRATRARGMSEHRQQRTPWGNAPARCPLPRGALRLSPVVICAPPPIQGAGLAVWLPLCAW